ncbi:hypothetical protein TNIN_283511 [Trichonephila inaurata madagascariensis]|uniref:Uncharacterized protein n=1 Tax=Trichonephila inaurata madagascariensis TaxID=2747483 RepID=A0A8X6Y2S8_9ARAC|nr:hypothetical protein TNIN_283511 [Trichonephila inaurata madagascariensis]
MRQLIAVTPNNPNRNTVETGSYTRWNNQAYSSVHRGTDPRYRFQSRGYHGQQHQSHMVRFNGRQQFNREYLHLFKLDISIRKMCDFQFGKNLSNVKYVNKCVNELRAYHGTYCKTLNNDQIMNSSNANNENNINVKDNKGLDQVPDSPEADLRTQYQNKLGSNGKI